MYRKAEGSVKASGRSGRSQASTNPDESDQEAQDGDNPQDENRGEGGASTLDIVGAFGIIYILKVMKAKAKARQSAKGKAKAKAKGKATHKRPAAASQEKEESDSDSDSDSEDSEGSFLLDTPSHSMPDFFMHDAVRGFEEPTTV